MSNVGGFIYIWECIENVSSRYHPEGGLAVVAEDQDAARAMIAATKNIEVTEREWERVIVLPIAGEIEHRIISFPDAGCC